MSSRLPLAIAMATLFAAAPGHALRGGLGRPLVGPRTVPAERLPTPAPTRDGFRAPGLEAQPPPAAPQPPPKPWEANLNPTVDSDGPGLGLSGTLQYSPNLPSGWLASVLLGFGGDNLLSYPPLALTGELRFGRKFLNETLTLALSVEGDIELTSERAWSLPLAVNAEYKGFLAWKEWSAVARASVGATPGSDATTADGSVTFGVSRETGGVSSIALEVGSSVPASGWTVKAGPDVVVTLSDNWSLEFEPLLVAAKPPSTPGEPSPHPRNLSFQGSVALYADW